MEEERNRWLVYIHFVARIFEVVEVIQSTQSSQGRVVLMKFTDTQNFIELFWLGLPAFLSFSGYNGRDPGG